MNIAVIGGTGTLGHHVVEQARSRGHEARSLSRSSADFPVDLTTGAGLEAALAGVEVVIDASNAQKGAQAVLVEGSRRLLAAERDAGVRHHVLISIVGIEQTPVRYYATKVAQERVVSDGPVPWTIVRATQFHELLAGVFGAVGRFRLLPLPSFPVQPVAAAEVAPVLLDVAEGRLRDGRIEVAGPEVLDARAAGRAWRAAGHSAFQVAIPVPGRLGRALRAGGLTSKDPDVRGTMTFAQWLAQ
jgi:uncharacterized protein YbjT (DUF2867 family)